MSQLTPTNLKHLLDLLRPGTEINPHMDAEAGMVTNHFRSARNQTIFGADGDWIKAVRREGRNRITRRGAWRG